MINTDSRAIHRAADEMHFIQKDMSNAGFNPRFFFSGK
jgi:hypothetical protein